MKLGTIIAATALAMAMTLGAAVTPADAGKKGKQVHSQGSKQHAQHGSNTKQAHHQQGSKKHAHEQGSKKKIHVRINDGLNAGQRERLEKAAEKLPGPYKDALLGEIERRREIHRTNEEAKYLGKLIGKKEDITEQVEWLGLVGTSFGKRRKSGH